MHHQLSILDTDAIVPPRLYSAGYRLYSQGNILLCLLAPDDSLHWYHTQDGRMWPASRQPDPDAIAEIRAASPL